MYLKHTLELIKLQMTQEHPFFENSNRVLNSPMIKNGTYKEPNNLNEQTLKNNCVITNISKLLK